MGSSQSIKREGICPHERCITLTSSKSNPIPEYQELINVIKRDQTIYDMWLYRIIQVRELAPTLTETTKLVNEGFLIDVSSEENYRDNVREDVILEGTCFDSTIKVKPIFKYPASQITAESLLHFIIDHESYRPNYFDQSENFRMLVLDISIIFDCDINKPLPKYWRLNFRNEEVMLFERGYYIEFIWKYREKYKPNYNVRLRERVSILFYTTCTKYPAEIIDCMTDETLNRLDGIDTASILGASSRAIGAKEASFVGYNDQNGCNTLENHYSNIYSRNASMWLDYNPRHLIDKMISRVRQDGSGIVLSENLINMLNHNITDHLSYDYELTNKLYQAMITQRQYYIPKILSNLILNYNKIDTITNTIMLYDH